ncbi:hypothetical protein H4Q26_004967 [Puccinia striiformis f. sp. tritici PST-130]|nr:hypothetical protein H4Q26_004967 [Puccinia striiformis f. sp. tritici PST-130]
MQHHIRLAMDWVRPTHLDLQTENAHALCADQKPSILGQITNLSQQHADHEIFQPCAPSSPPNSGIETSTGIQDTTDLKKYLGNP